MFLLNENSVNKICKTKILEKYTVKKTSFEAWGKVDVLLTKTFLTPLLIDWLFLLLPKEGRGDYNSLRQGIMKQAVLS